MLNVTPLKLVILCLASFRLSHFFAFDDITRRLREYFLDYTQETSPMGIGFSRPQPKGRGLRKAIGWILRCYWCTGVWTSLILLILNYCVPHPLVDGFLLLLAVAGAQSLLEHWVQTRI